MKIIKKFDSYLRENVDNKDIQMNDNELKDIEDTDNNKVIDSTEEEDEYIGIKMLEDLSKKLGVPFNGNLIEYKGKKINFFSETEKFHVDKKKFSSIDEVINYLKQENIEVNESLDEFDDDEFDDDFDDDFNDFDDDFDMNDIDADNYDLDAERNDDSDDFDMNDIDAEKYDLDAERNDDLDEEEEHRFSRNDHLYKESRITKKFRDFK